MFTLSGGHNPLPYNNLRKVYQLRGHVVVIEPFRVSATGEVNGYRLVSAGKLKFDPIARNNETHLLLEIDFRLPDWIKETQAAGISVPRYDPEIPITLQRRLA